MNRLLIAPTLALVLTLVATACGATDTSSPSTAAPETTTTTGAEAPDAGVSSAVGPGISVGEALESNLAGPLLVNGFLITDSDGTVRLAELLAESLPPQAGGATLIVEGLDLDNLAGLTSAQGITWSDQPVQLLGEVDDGVLTVSTLSSG